MEINVLAVIVAAIVSMVIGSIWYSPLLFGNIWMKLSDIKFSKDKKEQQAMMLRSYGLGVVSSLVLAYVLARFIQLFEADTAAAGAEIAFWAWLGFIVTTQFGAVLWEGRSYKVFLIGAGNMLVTLVSMGVILAVWPA